MKLFLILLISVLTGVNCYSQETVPLEIKKWTIKSIAFAQPYTFDRKNPLPHFFTGLGVKRNFKKINYRFSMENINYSTNGNSDSTNYSVFNNELTARIGAEYKMTYYEVIELNILMDFAVSKFRNEAINKKSTLDIDYIKKSNGIATGVIFGIGFDYYLKPSFSLFMETRLDVLFFNGEHSIQDYTNNSSINYTTNNRNVDLNILGNFGLNYHF